MANSKVLTLGFDDNTRVTLSYVDGADVVHANDDYYDFVFDQTGVFETAAALVTSAFFKNNSLLSAMRDQDLLEDYDRSSFDFENYVCKKMRETNWEHCFVDGTLEQYDYKHGYYRLRFDFETTLGELKQAIRSDAREVAVMEVTVHTDLGELTVNQGANWYRQGVENCECK